MLNPWRGLKGLPADVWIVAVTTLINRAGTMVLPFLVLYLSEEMRHPARVAGFALTVYGFGGLVSAPVAGRLCDRIGALRVMQFSLALSGVLLLLFPLVQSLPAIFALILAWSLIGEAVRPASLAALTGAIPAAQRTAALALNRLAINLGMSIGPAVGGFLAAASFPLLFVVDGVTSLTAALLLTVLLWRRPRLVASEAAPAAVVPSAGVLRDGRMMAFIATQFLVGAVFLQFEGPLPVFLVRDLGLGPSFFGMLFVLNTVMIVLFEVQLNVSMSTWAHRTSLVLGAALIGLGFGVLAFAGGAAMVVLTVVVWTFGEMILFPTAAAYVADLAPAERRGEYMGAYSMVFGLAMMVGPWTGTVLLERFGPVTLWLVMGACGLLAAFATGIVAAPVRHPTPEAAI